MLMVPAMAAAISGDPAAPVPMQPVQVSVAGVEAGRVVLDCRRAAVGTLDGCDVVEELPSQRGFAKAALGLIDKMKLEPGAPGRVRIPITFTPEETPHDLVRKPQWIDEPTARDYSVAFPSQAKTGGQGDLHCMVADDGRLKACIVTDVAPLGVGFSESILRLATRYRMQPLDKDGAPVAGRPVRVPLRFVLE